MDTLSGSPEVASAAAVPTKARSRCAGSPHRVAPAAAVATVSRPRCAGPSRWVAPAAAVLMVVRSGCAGSPRRVAPAAAVQGVVRSCCAGSPRRVAPAAAVLVEVRRCCAGSPRRVAPAAAVLKEAWSRCGGSPPSVTSRSNRADPEAVGSGDPGPVVHTGTASGSLPHAARGLVLACLQTAADAVARARQLAVRSHDRVGHTLEEAPRVALRAFRTACDCALSAVEAARPLLRGAFDAARAGAAGPGGRRACRHERGGPASRFLRDASRLSGRGTAHGMGRSARRAACHVGSRRAALSESR
jgi:hypothetical protein